MSNFDLSRVLSLSPSLSLSYEHSCNFTVYFRFTFEKTTQRHYETHLSPQRQIQPSLLLRGHTSNPITRAGKRKKATIQKEKRRKTENDYWQETDIRMKRKK